MFNKGGRSMSKFSNECNELLKYVGGKENISAVTHCVTRMRFVLKDTSKADKDAEYTVNGSKIFRTKIWYHRSCVERALTGAPRLKELNL